MTQTLQVEVTLSAKSIMRFICQNAVENAFEKICPEETKWKPQNYLVKDMDLALRQFF